MYFIFTDLKYKLDRLKKDLSFTQKMLQDTNNFLEYAKQRNFKETIIAWEFKKEFEQHQINHYDKLIKNLETTTNKFYYVIKNDPEYLREFLEDQQRALKIEERIRQNGK